MTSYTKRSTRSSGGRSTRAVPPQPTSEPVGAAATNIPENVSESGEKEEYDERGRLVSRLRWEPDQSAMRTSSSVQDGKTTTTIPLTVTREYLNEKGEVIRKQTGTGSITTESRTVKIAPKGFWGTSSRYYGEVSETGEIVIESPEMAKWTSQGVVQSTPTGRDLAKIFNQQEVRQRNYEYGQGGDFTSLGPIETWQPEDTRASIIGVGLTLGAVATLGALPHVFALAPVLKTPIISGLASMGTGYTIRGALGDTTPGAPYKLTTDFVIGASFPAVFSGAGKVFNLGTSVPGRIATAEIAGGIAGATGGFLMDVGEDVFQGKKVEFTPAKWGAGALFGFGVGGLSQGAIIGAETIAPKVWLPKIGRADLPDDQGSWTGLYIQKGEQAKPLLGFTQKGIGFGRPSVSITEQTFAGGMYLPKSSLETALVMDDLQNYYSGMGKGSEALRLRSGLGALEITKNINVPMKESLRDVIGKSERLGDVSDDLTAWIQKQKGIDVYGSVAQKAQLGDVMQRTPADIDIMIPNAEVKSQEVLELLQGKLGVENVRRAPGSTLIERQLGGNWVHMLDIHEKGGAFASLVGSQADDTIGFGFTSQNTVKSIEGVPTMRLSEQGIRKGVSSITPRALSVDPEPHRIKDIGDFETIQDFFTGVLQERGRGASASALGGFMDAFKSTRATVNTLQAPLGVGFSYSIGASALRGGSLSGFSFTTMSSALSASESSKEFFPSSGAFLPGSSSFIPSSVSFLPPSSSKGSRSRSKGSGGIFPSSPFAPSPSKGGGGSLPSGFPSGGGSGEGGGEGSGSLFSGSPGSRSLGPGPGPPEPFSAVFSPPEKSKKKMSLPFDFKIEMPKFAGGGGNFSLPGQGKYTPSLGGLFTGKKGQTSDLKGFEIRGLPKGWKL